MGRKIVILLFSMFVVRLAMADGNRNFTLVIDAGHGGHDAGALGAMSKEKNINLNVALAFGRYVEANCPDVKVIYTRKTDVFVTLHERSLCRSTSVPTLPTETRLTCLYPYIPTPCQKENRLAGWKLTPLV